MAQPGEAQSYYQAPPAPQQQTHDQPKYSQQPPQYGYNYGPQGYEAQGEKQDFQQAFKVDKPKWNDWWAGLLVR